jgi:hypothetical protein
MENKLTRIAIWPDDTWCLYPEEIDDYAWKSDDFYVMDVTDEELETENFKFQR